ncbi:predicted protein [Nematostella vectensis]|uniref:Potassium channel n=1 Tax=Nematostella vectensis TaxID=45351 RepID=A7SI05_NEMVE|eukprot:XP_001628706.1 predicted protein [Nematostella vectensis]
MESLVWLRKAVFTTVMGTVDYCCDPRRIVLNIRGERFETFERTLEQFPETLLGSENRRMPYFRPDLREYYFDRDKVSFDAILFYYQSNGILARPESVSEAVFEKELEFYDIHIEKEESPDKKSHNIEDLPKMKWQRKMWLFFDKPNSSRYATWFANMSMLVIIFSIVTFCVETLDVDAYARFDKSTHSQNSTANALGSKSSKPLLWFVIDTCIITWFTSEYIARLISAPHKLKFVFSTLALIDLIAIIPYFISLGLDADQTHAITFTVLRIFRLLRVIRLLKLTRYVAALRILGYTIQSCQDQLTALMFLLLISIILFSSLMYYLENEENPTEFYSIPAAFWWCIITMTTVGYGDTCPRTPFGRLVGACCAVFGVIVMVCLPTPVFILHFNNIYCRFLGIKLRDKGLSGDMRTPISTTLKVVRVERRNSLTVHIDTPNHPLLQSA